MPISRLPRSKERVHLNSLPELLKAEWKRNFELTAKMPHQVRVDATPVRHELIAIVAIPYEKLGYLTLGFIEPQGDNSPGGSLP